MHTRTKQLLSSGDAFERLIALTRPLIACSFFRLTLCNSVPRNDASGCFYWRCGTDASLQRRLPAISLSRRGSMQTRMRGSRLSPHGTPSEGWTSRNGWTNLRFEARGPACCRRSPREETICGIRLAAAASRCSAGARGTGPSSLSWPRISPLGPFKQPRVLQRDPSTGTIVISLETRCVVCRHSHRSMPWKGAWSRHVDR
jgi:hypothetical protein